MELTIDRGRLKIDLRELEKVVAVRPTSFDIPLEHVVAAKTDVPETSWKEVRAPGTYLPGIIKAGTYYSGRGKEFWYVTRNRDFLVLELKDEAYRRIVLNVDRSDQWAERINKAISKHH